jgi:anti-sigma B factor antagonist
VDCWSGSEGVVVGLTATTRKVENVNIVDLSGRITIGEGTVILKETVKTLLQMREPKILLNLGEITYIDSSGIGELVSSFTMAGKQGGKLKLLNLTKKVHDLLSITKLLTVFEVFDDEAMAIRSFS